ncbi:hypothetical protein G7Y89_g14809 [Cudoniella acicularis]|uniref:Uncharacterized protein n=1 Tax=Cudoniella acicularis TaxID=354080 RepID=A0A8H4QWX9_9HELO|nr:hypothetical protein G7Y89_g14809 [Cudoniella acicularis]
MFSAVGVHFPRLMEFWDCWTGYYIEVKDVGVQGRTTKAIVTTIWLNMGSCIVPEVDGREDYGHWGEPRARAGLFTHADIKNTFEEGIVDIEDGKAGFDI